MDSQVIEDQKELSLAVLDQAVNEADQAIGLHATVIDHQAHQALVAHRRDHLGAHALRRDAGHWRLACRGKATAKGAVAAQTGLVDSVNDRPLGFRDSARARH